MSLENQHLNVGNEDVVKKIEEKYGLMTTSSEETRQFQLWQERSPQNSIEQPIQISSVNECFDYLPSVGNPTTEKVNLFFEKENLSDEDLTLVLTEVANRNLDFEISIIQYNDNIFSIGIGNSVRNPSTVLDGKYFGHYHPLKYKWENAENLPEIFLKGLLPSAGDVRGYHRFPETTREGTKISSRFGSVFIKPIEKFELSESELDDYKQKYFKLFLGENNFGWESIEDVIDYFRGKLGLELIFSFNEIAEVS